MEIGSILLLLAVLLLVGIYVSRPFYKPPEPGKPGETPPGQEKDESDFYSPPDDKDHYRSSLLAEYDRLLNTIQDLEFDHTLNKIPEEDYPVQRAELLQAGAEVLKKLDAIQSAPVSQGAAAKTGEPLTADERFAAAAHKKMAPVAVVSAGGPAETAGLQPELKQAVDTQPGPSEADLEQLIASHRQARSEKSNGFCPHCGRPVHKSDHYCPKCGTAL